MRVSASYAMLLHFIAVSVVSRCSCDVSHVASFGEQTRRHLFRLPTRCGDCTLQDVARSHDDCAGQQRQQPERRLSSCVLEDDTVPPLSPEFADTHFGFSPPCCATASRLQAQSDSVFRIFGAKCRAHPENEVGLMVMGGKGSVVHLLSTAAVLVHRPARSRCYE